jgi:drug/metabolite transporter (DMT)-like permease
MEHLPPNPLFHKPASIVAAKNIMYATIFLVPIIWAIERWSGQNANAPATQTVVTLIVTMIVLFALTKAFTSGLKWARVVLLVLFLLGLIAYIWVFAILWQTGILVAMLSLLQTTLQAIALGFLFTRESTQWFDRVSDKKRNEPLPNH